MAKAKASRSVDEAVVEVEEIEMGVEDEDEDVDIEGKEDDEEQGGDTQETLSGATVGVWMGLGKLHCLLFA